MMPAKKLLMTSASALLLAFSVTACNNDNSPTSVPKAFASEPRVCSNCGTVTSIEAIKTKGSASGIGAVTGAVIGGVVGHQFGKGKGNDAATVAGAGAGAYAGHESEKQYNASTSYRVTVSMESGGSRTVDAASLNGAGVGSKVKVNGDSLTLM